MCRVHKASCELSPEALADLVHEARGRTLELVHDLADDQLTVPVAEIVNPFLWELGHVAFFYDVFVLNQLDQTPFHMDGAERLYDSFEVDHDDRWGLPLPSRPETLAYMEQVLERVVGRLGSESPGPEETYCYLLAVLHEDMHGEAFAYMRQTLEYPVPLLENSNGRAAAGPLPGDVEIPGCTYMLGATPELPFVFDNEKWAHPVEVAAFQIARAPVTNGEFVAFVEDKGYHREELWSHPGWVWRRKTGTSHPIYWCRGTGSDGWLRRDFDRVVPLEEHAPVVHVTWHEAEAFCNWAGRRLPTEAEWELAASGQDKRRYPWGNEPPARKHANLDSNVLGCADVGAFPAGDSVFGCRQMLGNVWEWTASAFFPFPGYVVDSPYKEYSAPWFGYRKVLKGGAWATRSRLACNTYRNFFPPDRNDVFAGFRTCAR
jgi:iron(II)-dependent oxidoreductase